VREPTVTDHIRSPIMIEWC